MNLFFTLLSGGYIAVIFAGADSGLEAYLSAFNPLSFLHIPLYAVLALLLLLALSKGRKPAPWKFLLVAGIAGAVAILDEIHQLSIPQRDASVGDVFLDLGGISLTLVLALRLPAAYQEKFFKILSRLGIA